MAERILIWGAGAIGGSVGAWLKRGGHDVGFVDLDPEHVAAIRDRGLRITGPVEQFAVAAPAFLAADLPTDLSGTWPRIFLAVKAHHTESATRALVPHLAQDGYVLSLQNGLNETIIQRIVGRDRTLGAFINFGADWMAPGEIMFGNRGAVVLGELDGAMTPRLAALHAVMHGFEPDAIVTPDIWSYLWGKLGYGAMLFAPALGQKGIADCLARPELLPLWRRLGEEAIVVAEAEGVHPRGFQRLRRRGVSAGCDRGGGAAERGRDGGVQQHQRENPFRRVARPCDPPATHRDGRADRAHRRDRRTPRHRLPGNAPAGGDDPRSGGGKPCHDRRQSAGTREGQLMRSGLLSGRHP